MPPNFKVVNDEEIVTITVDMTKRVYSNLKKAVWARSLTGHTVGAEFEVTRLMVLAIEDGDSGVFIRYTKEA